MTTGASRAHPLCPDLGHYGARRTRGPHLIWWGLGLVALVVGVWALLRRGDDGDGPV